MSRTALTTRERMVISTALLVRERGARATSIDDVLAHSRAPRGSVYHHFPGGRDQLLREATAYAGEFVADRLTVPDGGDAVVSLDAFLEGYRADLIAGGFRAGCPVVAVAIESREEDTALVDEAAAAFARWEDLLAGSFTAAGVAAPRAHELALTVIASVEGALILCRARRDIAPLDAVSADLRTLLQAEIAA